MPSSKAVNRTSPQNIMRGFDVARDNVILNACEEPGRVDIMKHETAEDDSPTDAERKLFEQGKCDLYLVTYTGHLQTLQDAEWTIK